MDYEPEISAEDTQPRAPIVVPLERPQETLPEEPRGCANPLLLLFVLLSLVILFVATVGLAGVAGYRDGVNDAATYAARTRVAVLGTQRALIGSDLQSTNWESALARCEYVGTLQPGDPGIAKCIDDAQRALSATPTPTTTPTSLPLTATLAPTLALTATQSQAVSPQSVSQELMARAQEELRKGQYETAIPMFEAVLADPTFSRQEIVPVLCSTYEKYGSQLDSEGRVSEMVVVISKAIKMSCRLTRNDWEFTINAAQLYLDAKGYLDAGNYTSADKVFRRLMALTTSYQDTKVLGCQTFAKVGDTDASTQYSC